MTISDTEANKVLHADTGRDFVDFLFNLLSLPVGAVIKLLTGRSKIGCIENVYQSVGNLNQVYMQPNLGKDILLNPKASISVLNTPKQLYTCSKDHGYVTNEYGGMCPGCNRQSDRMTKELTYPGAANTIPKGYVQDLVSYMVSDDLSITPMSMRSRISLNKCIVSQLEVRVVEIGQEESLELLKASLQSEGNLTAVFLGKEGV